MRTRLLAWGRLLRLSLAPSAAADVAAGAVLALGSWPSGASAWLAMLGSLCVYHGGLVLNDWADIAHDRATRPDRPLPAGAIAPERALALAWTLLLAGPAIALWAHPQTSGWLAAAAAGAVIYDLWGRGPWAGPSCLAFCRAANLSAGIALGLGQSLPDAPPRSVLALAPLLYGAYVFAVSRLGRLEDGEDAGPLGRRPALRLLAIAALLPAIGALAFLCEPAAGPWPSFALGLAGAHGLAHLALSTPQWTRARIGGAMGAALRRLLVPTAALALAASGPHGFFVATAILCGYPISYVLRGWFPPS